MAVSNISSITSDFSSYIPADSYIQGVMIISTVSVIAITILKCSRKHSGKPLTKAPEPTGQSLTKDPKPTIVKAPICYPIRNWKSKNYEIELVRENRDFFWIIRSKATSTVSKGPAIPDAYMYETYAKDVLEKDRKLIFSQAKKLRQKLQAGVKHSEVAGWLRDTPLKQRISYFKDVGSLQLKNLGNNQFDIRPELLVCISKYGKKINRDYWGVTVVCAQGESNIDEGLGNYIGKLGHSYLIYEGIKEGKYFIHHAHLVKKDEIGARVIHETKNLFNFKKMATRSQTWIRSSEKVTKMVEAIELDTEKQKEGNFLTYSALGGKSIPEVFMYVGEVCIWLVSGREPSSLGVNCHTWIKNKLTYADIHPTLPIELIAAIPIISTSIM